MKPSTRLLGNGWDKTYIPSGLTRNRIFSRQPSYSSRKSLKFSSSLSSMSLSISALTRDFSIAISPNTISGMLSEPLRTLLISSRNDPSRQETRSRILSIPQSRDSIFAILRLVWTSSLRLCFFPYSSIASTTMYVLSVTPAKKFNKSSSLGASPRRYFPVNSRRSSACRFTLNSSTSGLHRLLMMCPSRSLAVCCNWFRKK